MLRSSVYQYFSGGNDSSSNTEWSQRHNLYQKVITKVSNNKPFVKSNLLKYKSHNIISIQNQFIRNNVTKHSDYFVWKDTSERVARRCDDTVDEKRLNSCVLKHLLQGVEQPQKWPKYTENALSDVLLMSRFQNFAADDTKKTGFLKPRFARF